MSGLGSVGSLVAWIAWVYRFVGGVGCMGKKNDVGRKFWRGWHGVSGTMKFLRGSPGPIKFLCVLFLFIIL